MKKIRPISRVLLSLGALALIGMLFVPIWEIYLTAPQYPEGLTMKIWHHTLTGDVQVISALNHYIGMAPISVEMFPEFRYLSWIIWTVALLCLALALIGRLWSAIAYYLVLAVVDCLGMYDFWHWGYRYGHNLNPEAPIVIPGMAYQPPLIGYKKLLNFEAWSLPDAGGWILIVSTSLSLLVVVWEIWQWYKTKNRTAFPDKKAGRPAHLLALFVLLPLAITQCTSGPRPIEYGKDACHFCKMTLVDERCGAELATRKGKIYVFDDLNCFVRFIKEETVPQGGVFGLYVADFHNKRTLIPVENAVFLHSEKLQTPMASGIAAFSSLEQLQSAKATAGGEAMNWEQVKAMFK